MSFGSRIGNHIQLHRWLPGMAGILLIACKHGYSEDPTPILKNQTIIPEEVSTINDIPERIRVPSELLSIYKTSRPQVELRAGPGTEFPVHDQILSMETTVIKTNELGVWLKAYDPNQDVEGWVHNQTLKKAQVTPEYFEVPTHRLPLMIAHRDINQIFDFTSKQPIPFRKPRGSLFRYLTKQGTMILVYIPQTHSVAWMRAGDLR